MKKLRWAIAVFVLLGIVKLPLERAATAHLLREKAILAPPDLSMSENLGQMGVAAVLGGLRSLVGSVLYLQSYASHEKQDWAAVDETMSLACKLQPLDTSYWQSASDFMTYDASHYYKYNQERPRLYRSQLYDQHIRRGESILREGLKHLPESKRLWESLGHLYIRQMQTRGQPSDDEPWLLPDFRQAGECYERAFKCGALEVNERLAAYAWARTDDPALLQRALAILRRHYAKGIRVPGVMTQLDAVETKLGVPKMLRVR